MSGDSDQYSVDPSTGKLVQLVKPAAGSPFLSPIQIPVRSRELSRKRQRPAPRAQLAADVASAAACSFCNRTKGCVCYRCPVCEMKTRMVLALPCACLESCLQCMQRLPSKKCSLCKLPVERRVFINVQPQALLN